MEASFQDDNRWMNLAVHLTFIGLKIAKTVRWGKLSLKFKPPTMLLNHLGHLCNFIFSIHKTCELGG